jgi:NAD(P)-dependent dehydrogenase (short-subunit alcohol dehydrogenase family)
MSFWPNGCFDGHHVLVTGGTSGIGAAIARAFLSEGAIVTVTGISAAEAEKRHGGNARPSCQGAGRARAAQPLMRWSPPSPRSTMW